MSKRILLPLLIVALALGLSAPVMASNTAGWTFDIEVQVEPWIKKNDVNLPSEMKMRTLLQEQEQVTTSFRWYEAFYANVPFSKTFSGENLALDGLPIFARHEREKDGSPKLNRYDRLSTKISISTVTNAFPPRTDPNYEDLTVYFECGTQDSSGIPSDWGWWQPGFGAKRKIFSASITMGTPHDGEVWEKVSAKADRKMPDFTTDNAWWESADAGIYELTIIETLLGLNTAQSADAYVTHP